MSPLPLAENTVLLGVALLGVMLILVVFLLRNRERCPKDRAGMRFEPGKGHHMVFRCPKCGHVKKTKISIGRRR